MTDLDVHDVDTCPWFLSSTKNRARLLCWCGGGANNDVTLLGISDFGLQWHIENHAGPVELSNMDTATLLIESGAGRVQICTDPADVGTLRVGTATEVADVLSRWLGFIDSGALVTLPRIHRDLRAAVSALHAQEGTR